MVTAFQESNKSFLSPEVRTLVLTSSDQFLLNTASVRLLLLSGPLKAMIESAGHNWDTAKKDYATSAEIVSSLSFEEAACVSAVFHSVMGIMDAGQLYLQLPGHTKTEGVARISRTWKP